LCPQPDAQATRLPLGRVRGRYAGAGVPYRGVHRVAGAVLRRHDIGVLRGAAVRAVRTVRDHRPAPDGQPGNGGAEHQPGGAPVPPAGGAHAGYRGRVLLHVPVTVSGAHPVDHPGAARLQHHGAARRQELLPAAVLQPHHAVHQLGAQPHPVQPHVVQVPGRVPAAVRPAPRPVGQPAPGPQGHGDHDLGARGRLGHRRHHHHHHHRHVERKERRRQQRPDDCGGHGQHVRPHETQRRHRRVGDRPERPDVRRRRPAHHQAVEQHDRGGHAETTSAVTARELRLMRTQL